MGKQWFYIKTTLAKVFSCPQTRRSRLKTIALRALPLMPASGVDTLLPMPEIPQRVSLLAQAVDSLRRGIAGGEWTEVLPPERALCESLHISRSTLRRALDKIEEEGLIAKGRSGKRRRIIASPHPSSFESGPRGTRSIVWLTRQPLLDLPSINLRLIAQLQSRLSAHDCILNVVRVPDKPLANPDAHMEDWLKELSANAWILHLMPEGVQQWFYRHQPVTCIVGSRAPGVALASIEIDSTAPLQHAVAMLRRHGHQRVGLIRPEQHLVGEERLEESLLELFEDPSLPTVLACPSDPTRMARRFKKVFASKRGSLPTALICSTPRLALFTLTWLQQHRIPVPGQVSLIVLRSQPILDFASPSLAHYTIHEERAITQLLPRLLDLLQTHVCSTSHINLIPEFVPGDSLGAAP